MANRIIKFRAWVIKAPHRDDELYLGMFYGAEQAYDTLGKMCDGKGVERDYLWPSFGDVLEEEKDGYLVLMQYTGVRDVNGKEIYEGDIVDEFRTSRSFPEGRHIKRVIEWQDDMTLDDGYGCTAVGFNMFGGGLEVIGNVYENPNLLNLKAPQPRRTKGEKKR